MWSVGVVISVLLGFIYANFLDWGVHILLHKPKGKSRFKFHWKHHKLARKNQNKDPDYSKKLMHNETYLTLLGIALHVPLVFVNAPFACTAMAYGAFYMVIHRLTHTYVEFFKKWMPWHYEHHMGRNQNANWCVVCPLMDHIMNTRVKYLDKS